jgi:hypothetical protein
LRVIVVDPDANETVDETVLAANLVVSGPAAGTGAQIDGSIGETAVIELDGQAAEQIAGLNLADVQANTSILATGSNELNVNNGGGELRISDFFAGDGINDPWLLVTVLVAGTYDLVSVTYQTSIADTVVVTVKSDLETTGVTIQADETGLSTGIFHGFVRLVPTTGTSAGSTGAGAANAGQIRTSVGPVTVQVDDVVENVIRTSSALVDISAPVPSITSPANGTATQNRRPTFSAGVSETGAGLDISTIMGVYDSNDDPSDTLTKAINVATGQTNGSAVALAFSTSGALDGDLAFSFSQAPAVDLPNAGVTQVDHLVDWGVLATDLAGNIGVSDANGSTTGIQLPTVQIDQTLPTLTGTPAGTGADHKSGVALGSDGNETRSRRSLRLAFNDRVQNVQASDFVVTLDSGATVVPTSVTVDNDLSSGTLVFPVSGQARSVVYLGFLSDLVSNETPRVDLQDSIQDLAGNSTTNATASNVGDGIRPNLTVTLSGGSGTGSGSEGPSQLTKQTMVVRVASDESLSSAPTVTVYPVETGTTPPEVSPTALSQGTNIWDATYVAGLVSTGDRAVVVSGTDSAANTLIVGGEDTKSFRLDNALISPALSIGGGSTQTSQLRPFVTIDFGANGESATVTVSEVLLDGADVTSTLVASSGSTRFFIAPSSDLSLGAHTVTIPIGEAADAAGNTNSSAITLNFTVIERASFNIGVFAGWNAISFPSDPLDPDINSVFTNVGHDAVLGFDPNVPGMWRIATRDSVSGELETTTANGLNSVRSTQAYWVHSNNFEPIEALLVGETLPGDGNVPSLPQIPTVLGFNAVPVVDADRKQTTGGPSQLQRTVPGTTTPAPVTVADYLGAVNEGRVYLYDPATLNFVALAPNTIIETGSVLFVEVVGTATPIFP